MLRQLSTNLTEYQRHKQRSTRYDTETVYNVNREAKEREEAS